MLRLLAELDLRLFSDQRSIVGWRLCHAEAVMRQELQVLRISYLAHVEGKVLLYPDLALLETVDEAGWGVDD